MSEDVQITSWGSRLMNSIKGVLFGLALFLGSFVLLFLNEGRALKTAQGLEEGLARVVNVAADKVDPAMENKLVHLTAPAVTTEKLKDAQFGVEKENALRLSRQVEMFQWLEQSKTKTEKQLGGSEKKTTTYTYATGWSGHYIDSTKFHDPNGHTNPAQMEFSSDTIDASPVTVGAFTLPQDMLRKLTPATPIALMDKTLEALPPSIKSRAKIDAGQLFIGANPAKPQVGDTRVKFLAVDSGAISLIAKQAGKSFQPYVTKADTTLSMIKTGEQPADLMFKEARDANKALTWILRGVGLLLMTIGLGLIFAPFKTFADVVPFLGSVLEMGIGIFALAVSLVLSVITIGVAWLFYRPLIGACLIAGAVALLVFLKTRKGNKPALTTPQFGPAGERNPAELVGAARSESAEDTHSRY